MRVTQKVLSDLVDDVNHRFETLNDDRRLIAYMASGHGYIGLKSGDGGGHWQISLSGTRREVYYWLHGYAYLIPFAHQL